MANKSPRPARTLLIFGLAIVVLYGLAALGQTWKPRLGLDLEGGTRITLTALSNGGRVDQTKLKQAASIVDARVNGSGVSESEVSTQGSNNIVVEIPGKNAQNLVDAVKRTAQLRFRLVVGSPQQGRPQPTPSASPSPSGSASPGASPSGSPSAGAQKPGGNTAGPGPSASPKPRPAPAWARGGAGVPQVKPTKKPTKKPKPATPTAGATQTAPAQPGQPGQTQVTAKGADVNKPLEWVKDPGVSWLQKYSAFQCPPQGKEAAPTVDDPDKPLITCDNKGAKFLLSKAFIEGTDLKDASYGTPQNSTQFAVTLKLKGGEPTKTFGDYSTAVQKSGGLFAIVLDGQVISYASVNEPILDGNAQITGSFTEGQARSLSNSLKYGALPIKFAKPTVETIGPSLAGNQLQAGILAGVIGLAIVMVYCLFYYRGLGLVVIASLIVAAVTTYATVLVLAKAAGFTLTLPGIAGLIVAVGITADSFIVYFERIRDEMRAGRSMRVAVESGWSRARNTCLAADGVSLIAAVVLYIFAIGVVKGFAFALGVSTIIDIAVFFWFTKPMMTLLARRRFFNSGHRLSGLSEETLGLAARRGRIGSTVRGRA